MLKFPELPKPLTIRVTDYYGNEEDGVYRKGERVLVALYKPYRLFGQRYWRVGRVAAYVMNPAAGEDAVQKAVDDVYASYLRIQEGLRVAAATVTK